jgi:CRP/FNR family transcriptional regulator, anaerobic regulatory protein
MKALLHYLNTIHPLSPELEEHLCGILRRKDAAKKELLLRAGHVCRNLWFVEQGLVRCYYIRNGQQVCSWFMKEGDVIASVESFFQQTPSYEYIEALEDCVLYYVEHEALEAAYHRFPDLNFVGRVLVQKYYVLSEQRLYAMRLMRAQERYDYLLTHHDDLIQRVSDKHMASYLGISDVHYSNIKNSSHFLKKFKTNHL